MHPSEVDDAMFGGFSTYVLALPVDTRSAVVKSMLRFLTDFRKTNVANGPFLQAAAEMEVHLSHVNLTGPSAPVIMGTRYSIPE